MLSDTAKLSGLLNHPDLKSVWPADVKFLYSAKPEREDGVEKNYIALHAVKGVKGQAILNGDVITEARQDYNELSGGVEVIMQMNAKGSEQWATITDNNKGRAIAIVMDEVVYSAPMVNEKITGGRSQISGNFTVDEGSDLANVLKSGTLPARAIIVDEQIIGPSLGAANVSSGINSFILAMLVVLLYMYVYYKKAGLIANVALIANVFFLIGSLASIQASLTLPGIAGIVLTIGMAVDANVLIYERIREELRGGKSLKTAVNDGFKFALSSIIDGNLTTLLTAIVLATFGTGPVLGFAVTLIIGIMTSLFSAIFISRLIIHELLDRKQDISFSTKFSENLMVGTKINFMGRRKIWYIVSSLFIIAGIASLFTRSLDYGVEFTGGRTYEITFQDEANYDKIRDNLGAVFVENGQKLTPEVKMIENKFKAKITTKYLVTDQDSTADRKVEDALKTGLKEWEGKYTIDAQRKIGGVISSEMISSSIWSVVFSLIVIFAYIYIRFRKWQFGFAAVLALFHDAMIVLSVFSLCYGILPFSMEIDQAFIAAILTVIGYSINDTVVVFDRIREYMVEHKRMDTPNMINSALNSTLTRTINTSLTTLIVLVVIFIFGGDSIKGFTFALLVGIGVGTYSSLFIASPIVYDFAGNTLTEGTEKKD
jgi:SecD/SecF fusion protein